MGIIDYKKSIICDPVYKHDYFFPQCKHSYQIGIQYYDVCWRYEISQTLNAYFSEVVFWKISISCFILDSLSAQIYLN